MGKIVKLGLVAAGFVAAKKLLEKNSTQAAPRAPGSSGDSMETGTLQGAAASAVRSLVVNLQAGSLQPAQLLPAIYSAMAKPGSLAGKLSAFETAMVEMRPVAGPGLKENFSEARLSNYCQAMARHVPEDERESQIDLSRWLQDPEDPLQITPIMHGNTVVGGAHAQIPEPISGDRPHNIGALEYAWGPGPKTLDEAIKGGLGSVRANERTAVFADVPVGQANREELEEALQRNGFRRLFQAQQPPLEKGGEPTEVITYVRGTPTLEEAVNFYKAYHASFASMEGSSNVSTALINNPQHIGVMEELRRTFS